MRSKEDGTCRVSGLTTAPAAVNSANGSHMVYMAMFIRSPRRLRQPPDRASPR